MRYFFPALIFLAFATAGCSHVMSEASLATVDSSVSYSDIKMNPEKIVGRNVLVGGMIAGNSSSGDLMALEVAQLELLSNGIPDELSRSAGRFMVVSGELLDPLFYRTGMLITVIGEIKGQQVKTLDGIYYRYPLISAKEIKLFRASEQSTTEPFNPYQNQIGDGRFMLRPPGGAIEEPRKPF